MSPRFNQLVYDFPAIAFRPDHSLSGELQIPCPWTRPERIETPTAPDPLKRANLLRPDELELLLSPDWPAVRSNPTPGKQQATASASQIAVLNEAGTIISVNHAWRAFADVNGLNDESYGLGTNYLEVCEMARGPGAYEAQMVARGIRDVLEGRYVKFSFNYPAHGAENRQWYSVRVSRWVEDGMLRLIVAHDEIR
jgi:hypothetical protein